MEPRKMMGAVTPGDQRVNVAVRDWNALKLALWRSKVAWGIAERAAAEIVGTCRHREGCPALHDETAPCLQDRYVRPGAVSEPSAEDLLSDPALPPAELVEAGCPDRELRMSSLVILNAARMFAPITATRPAAELYMAPSREYFSEIMAELVTTQAELEAMREMARAAGVEVPMPQPIRPSILHTPQPLPQLEEPK